MPCQLMRGSGITVRCDQREWETVCVEPQLQVCVGALAPRRVLCARFREKERGGAGGEEIGETEPEKSEERGCKRK